SEGPGPCMGGASCIIGVQDPRDQAGCWGDPGSVTEPRTPPPAARPAPPPSHHTHLLRLFGGEEAGLPASREVAMHLEGVAGAALIGVDPVLAWGGGVSVHKESSSPLLPPTPPPAAQSLALPRLPSS
uniref:Uncharacterized protein n=1 Tax=Terrapene triunguis TaxID=2587831 RepID=A0A674JT28_9SAUR